MTAPWCSKGGLADNPMRIPEAGPAVEAAGQDRLAIGTERAAITPPWCTKGLPSGWPLAMLQSRALLSRHPVRSVRPSGLNATAITAAGAAKDADRGSPVAAFQRRAVPSRLAVRRNRAVGAEHAGEDSFADLQGQAAGAGR